MIYETRDTRWRSWLEPQAARLRFSFPMVTWEYFHNPNGLRLTQSLREMSTRNVSWFVKVAGT